jgi:hypothetical protein
VSTQKVLGLDLAKTALPDAIAAMVEAWYEAQAVDDEPQILVKKHSAEAANLISQSEFARLVGVSLSAVIYAIKNGLITEIAYIHGKTLIRKNEALQQYKPKNRQTLPRAASTHPVSASAINCTRGAELIRAKTGRACSHQNLEKLCKKGALQGSPCILQAKPLRFDPDLLVSEYQAKVGRWQIGAQQPTALDRDQLA